MAKFSISDLCPEVATRLGTDEDSMSGASSVIRRYSLK